MRQLSRPDLRGVPGGRRPRGPARRGGCGRPGSGTALRRPGAGVARDQM